MSTSIHVLTWGHHVVSFVGNTIGESGESCIMSKWYLGDLFQKYPTDEKAGYRKEPPYRFLPILVLLAAEVEESRDK